MHPDFDLLVDRVEGHLLSEMTVLGKELQSMRPEFTIETFSHRHSEGVHSLGLWCAAPHHNPLIEDDSRGIVVNVFGFNGLSIRGFVHWNRTYPSSPTSKAQHTEFMTRIYTTECAGGPSSILMEAPKLYSAMKRAHRRGSPLGTLRRAWYRLIGRID
jgi:hypothetical protein